MAGQAVTTSLQPILPAGDSFPTRLSSAHSIATPQNVAAGGSSTARTTTKSGTRTPGTSVASAPPSTATTSFNTTTEEALSSSVTLQAAETANGAPAPLQAGAIVAIVLAILVFIVLVIFAVRRYFVHQRASKVTPARTRASQLAISGPTNFQHVASADGTPHTWNASDKYAANVGTAEVERWNPQRQSSLRSPTDSVSVRDDGAWTTGENPYSRNQQKYTVDFGALESGLRDHVQTMRGARATDSS